MARAQFVGVGGVARKVANVFVGVGGVARKIKTGFNGISGVARQFLDSGVTVEGGDANYSLYQNVPYGTALDLSRFSRVRGTVYLGESDLQVNEHDDWDTLLFTGGWFSFDFSLADGQDEYERQLTEDEIDSCFDTDYIVEQATLRFSFNEDGFDVYLYIDTNEGPAYCPSRWWYNEGDAYHNHPTELRYSLTFSY